MKKELLAELEEKFDILKKERGLKSNLEELDKAFFIKDYISSQKFVSENLSRQLCLRISETLFNWVNYLQGMIMPQGNLFLMNEGNFLGESGKKEVTCLLTKVGAIISLYSISSVEDDKEKEREFIDSSCNFWFNEFKPEVLKILNKIHLGWKKQVEEIN